jgi:hypothetical protein
MPTKRAIGNVTASNELIEMAMAFGPSCVLCAAARLGVADALGDVERSGRGAFPEISHRESLPVDRR